MSETAKPGALESAGARTDDGLATGDTLDRSSGAIDTGDTLTSASGASASRATHLLTVDPSLYEVGRELARGGMGRIRIARDRRLARFVAIKELLGLDAGLRARFAREVRITARLQHPSIISVLEAGTWPDGDPFFAMTLVAGTSLDKAVAEHPTLAGRLALLPRVGAVADALAYAHSERVIHRDLKPANVLVGDFGETVVIDWGLAKDLDDEGAGDVDVGPYRATGSAGDTVAGSVMGTPSYMPPEQARGEPVDERADVYSLGALLYHVLAGVPPYAPARGAQETLAAVLQGPPTPLEAMQPGVPVDLVAIVRKAMRRAPADRYQDARAMAEDLRRFQTGQLVGARRYTRRELALRFVRRHRVTFGVGAALLALLLGTATVSLRRVLAERDRADDERSVAFAERERAQTKQADAERARAQATERTDALTLLQARSLLDSDPTRAIAYLQTLSPTFSNWSEARLLALALDQRPIATFVLPVPEAGTMALSPNGKRLVFTTGQNAVVLVDLETGRQRTLEGPGAATWHVQFLDDDHFVTAGHEDRLRLWDVASGVGEPIGEPATNWVVSLEVTPDGSTIASLTGIGELRVFDVVRRSSRSLKVTFEEQGEAVVAVSPDARWVAAGGSGGVRIFGLASAARWSFPTPDRVKELAFSPDGRSLAYVSGGTFSIHVVDLRSGAVRVLPGEGFVGTSRGLLSVTFSPDSAMLVAGSDDATLRVWDLARGRVRVVPARTGFVSFVLFDGPHTVLACNSDTKCALYDAGSGKTLAEFSGHRNALVDVRLSADRTKLATLSADRTLRVWAMPTPDRRPLVVGEDKLSSVRVAPDSQGLVVTTDGRGALYYPSQGAPPREVATRQTGTGAFRPDGLELAVAEGARVRLVELATGRTRDLVGHTEPLYDVEYSPRGDRLASAGTDKTVRLWDLAAGTSRLFAGHERAVARVDFSPDGLVLASAGFDGAIRLWTVETGESVVLPTNANMVFGVRFSPDGARLVTSQDDGTILVWNVKQRVVERRLEGHSGAVYLAAVSVDGQLVASASADHTVRLADLATGASVELGHHLSEAQEVSFSPDGRRLVSCGWDGLVRFYPLEVPSGPAVRAWLDGRTRARLGADDVFGSAAQ